MKGIVNRSDLMASRCRILAYPAMKCLLDLFLLTLGEGKIELAQQAFETNLGV